MPQLLRNFPASVRDSSDESEFVATEQAISKLRIAKLPIPQRPVDEGGRDLTPKLSRDLASTTSGKLGTLLTEFTAMADYTSYAAALADIETSVQEHVLEYITARVRLEKTGTVQEKADKTTCDPRVREASKKYFEALALSKLTATLESNYERDLSAVSREITRRGQELGRT